MIQEFLASLQSEFAVKLLAFVFSTSPIWVPTILVSLFISTWLKYVRTKTIIKEGGVLLEIKLPRDVFKSPRAMELVLTSFYQAAKGNFFDTFVDGKTRPWFSLELVSIDGEIHFFVWAKKKYAKMVETQFYAQYPGVEVYQVDDYTKNVFLDPGKMGIVGLAFKLAKADIYPIKTYIDYGLDREQEEESKVDPITSVLEFMGGTKAGEQIWLQILIQAHRKTGIKEDAEFPQDDWKKKGEGEIKELIGKMTKGDGDAPNRALTDGEKETIAALQRSLTKLAFEVGIRGAYVFRQESFDPMSITGLVGSFRQYGANNLNEIRIGGGTGVDYAWDNLLGHHKKEREDDFLNAYKLRSYFQLPYKHLFTKPSIMTTEELATIFHLPGKVVGTPTLTKISSRKSEAPSNLPI